MSSLLYKRSEQTLYYLDNDNNVSTYYECHSDFEEGFNEEGVPRESLPNGDYSCWAEDYSTACNNGASYGTFYIHTGDSRGRDIHGGGSSLPDPYAPYQGWLCTYGCLRMQNADGEELSSLIIQEGNSILLEVRD